MIIIGNLTRDPEMRETSNGQSVTTFGIATNREWMTKNSERKNSAEFHECVAWARLAEICANYLKKGNLVYVEGYLKTRNWETPEGVKKFKTEIVVQDMIILEKRKAGDDDYVPEVDVVEDDDIDPVDSTPEERHIAETPEVESASEEAKPVEEATPSETPAPEVETMAESSAQETPTDEKKEDNPIDKDLGL